VGRGKVGRSSRRGGGYHNVIVKNCWRQQSTRGKAKGDVDNDCQDNRSDDAGQGAPKVDCNQREGAQSKCNNANDDHNLGNQLGLDFEDEFHVPKQKQRIKK
jgi:hypothetical protein